MLLQKTGFHPAVAWLVFVTAFLLLPGDDLPKEDWLDAIYADKLVHILFFAVLVCLFYRATRHTNRNWLPFITIAALAYGVAIEFIQERWAINRNFDGGDIIADTLGSAVGYIYSLRLKKNSRRKRRQRSK